MQEATVVADSIYYPACYEGDPIRASTFSLRYPKFIHGEFMTHRRFSRNASSSRAIPTKRMIEEVMSDALRAGPVFWGKNQSGMQAYEELDDTVPWKKGWTNTAKARAQQVWSSAAIEAARSAEALEQVGAHKQITNRILEPFLHINVVVTATDYLNFFGLRLDKAAQPEIRALAEAMWRAWNESTPEKLQPGDWHLPFISFEDKIATVDMCDSIHAAEDIRRMVSVARCARTSYVSFETGKRSTIEEDLKLYTDKLGLPPTSATAAWKPERPIHASPAEHQLTPDRWGHPLSRNVIAPDTTSDPLRAGWQHPEQHGNMYGYRQFRKMLPGESMAPLPEGYVYACRA